MRLFTLKQFGLTDNFNQSELCLEKEYRFSAASASEAKGWLTDLILHNRLEAQRFYRFDATSANAEVRPGFLLSASFYLFPDKRICPLRIREKSELFYSYRNDPQWTVDFEGVPPWSLIASIEPRWHPLRTVPATRPWMGRSRRDWMKRDCWTLQPVADPDRTRSSILTAVLDNI